MDSRDASASKKWSFQNSDEEDLCNLASSIPNAREYSSGLPGFVHELISVLIMYLCFDDYDADFADHCDACHGKYYSE